jgi:PAS domain S-box-containing protein
VLDTNPAGLALFEVDGYDDLLARPILPFDTPKDRHLLEALNQKVFDGGSETIVIEITACRGTQRRVELHAVPLRSGDGSIIAALSVTTDITERYETEAALDDALAGSAEGLPVQFAQLDAMLATGW